MSPVVVLRGIWKEEKEVEKENQECYVGDE